MPKLRLNLHRSNQHRDQCKKRRTFKRSTNRRTNIISDTKCRKNVFYHGFGLQQSNRQHRTSNIEQEGQLEKQLGQKSIPTTWIHGQRAIIHQPLANQTLISILRSVPSLCQHTGIQRLPMNRYIIPDQLHANISESNVMEPRCNF